MRIPWQGRWLAIAALGGMACGLALGCGREEPASEAEVGSGQEPPAVAVGTSMIECAVRSLSGGQVAVHRLGPPGQCPGHFDLTPGDFEAIVRSRLLLRHDYQGYLDEKLQGVARGRRIGVLVTAGAQTMPANYVDLCRQVADEMSSVFPALAPTVSAKLAEAELTADRIAADALRQAAPLASMPIVASNFQKEFCEWLGLRVVGEFDLADEMSLKDLERLVRAGREGGAVAVVANLQRGEREGRPIAERLGVPLVVLSNFPLEPAEPVGYRDLVAGNVQMLLAGCGHGADR